MGRRLVNECKPEHARDELTTAIRIIELDQYPVGVEHVDAPQPERCRGGIALYETPTPQEILAGAHYHRIYNDHPALNLWPKLAAT